MLDRRIFQNKDLILKVSPNIDPEKFDINKPAYAVDSSSHQLWG